MCQCKLEDSGFEEVGNNPNEEFTCDICGCFEYSQDEIGPFHTTMYTFPGGMTYCEDCAYKKWVGVI